MALFDKASPPCPQWDPCYIEPVIVRNQPIEAVIINLMAHTFFLKTPVSKYDRIAETVLERTNASALEFMDMSLPVGPVKLSTENFSGPVYFE